MPDTTFTRLKRERIPEEAPWWPGKTGLVLRGDQLNVTYFVVLNEDGTPHAWPKSLDDRIEDVVAEFG